MRYVLGLLLVLLLFTGGVSPGEQQGVKMWPRHFILTDIDNIESIIKANEVLVLNFWAGWCENCMNIIGIFWEEPEIPIAMINVNFESELAQRWGVRTLPTIIVLLLGEEQYRMSGNVKFELELSPNMLRENVYEFRRKELASPSDSQ
jgi:thiol-disulfide isomerase/thioredoxin